MPKLLYKGTFVAHAASPPGHPTTTETTEGPRSGAVAIARRIHAGYLAGTFPEERVCEIMTWIFAGWKPAEAEAFDERVLVKVGLDARLHAEALEVVAWARANNVTTTSSASA